MALPDVSPRPGDSATSNITTTSAADTTDLARQSADDGTPPQRDLLKTFDSLFCDERQYKRLRRGVHNFFDLANLVIRKVLRIAIGIVVGIIGWKVYGSEWFQKIVAVFDKLPW